MKIHTYDTFTLFMSSFEKIWPKRKVSIHTTVADEGEGEVAVFSAKCWDRRNSQALIESAIPCHDAQRCWWDLNPVHLTVLAAKSVDYNTAL